MTEIISAYTYFIKNKGQAWQQILNWQSSNDPENHHPTPSPQGKVKQNIHLNLDDTDFTIKLSCPEAVPDWLACIKIRTNLSQSSKKFLQFSDSSDRKNPVVYGFGFDSESDAKNCLARIDICKKKLENMKEDYKSRRKMLKAQNTNNTNSNLNTNTVSNTGSMSIRKDPSEKSEGPIGQNVDPSGAAYNEPNHLNQGLHALPGSNNIGSISDSKIKVANQQNQPNHENIENIYPNNIPETPRTEQNDTSNFSNNASANNTTTNSSNFPNKSRSVVDLNTTTATSTVNNTSNVSTANMELAHAQAIQHQKQQHQLQIESFQEQIKNLSESLTNSESKRTQLSDKLKLETKENSILQNKINELSQELENDRRKSAEFEEDTNIQFKELKNKYENCVSALEEKNKEILEKDKVIFELKKGGKMILQTCEQKENFYKNKVIEMDRKYAENVEKMGSSMEELFNDFKIKSLGIVEESNRKAEELLGEMKSVSISGGGGQNAHQNGEFGEDDTNDMTEMFLN